MKLATRPLYAAVAGALLALKNCRERDLISQAWENKWEEYLKRCEKALPLGGGFDLPPTVHTDEITPDLITIKGNFHPTDPYGGYKAWLPYTVKVTPSLANGFNLKVVCRDRLLREFIHGEFEHALATEYPLSQFHQKETVP